METAVDQHEAFVAYRMGFSGAYARVLAAHICRTAEPEDPVPVGIRAHIELLDDGVRRLRPRARKLRQEARDILGVAHGTWKAFERDWGDGNMALSPPDWENLRDSLVAFADALPRRLRHWVRLGMAIAGALDPDLGGDAALAAVPALEHQLSEMLPHRLLDALSPNCSGFSIEKIADLHADIIRRLSTRHPGAKPVVANNVAGLSKEGQALAFLVTNPEMTDTEIARRVGCNRTSLYRMPTFQAAKQKLAEGKEERPRGRRVVDGGRRNVEGVTKPPKK